jgi:hypothetical protein
MAEAKTHIQHVRPRMAARDLADYMAASEVSKRTIVRNSKYEPVLRVPHHDEARAVVAKFIADRDTDLSWLAEEAQRIRDHAASEPEGFERDLAERNAAYIERFAKVWPGVRLPPKAEVLPVGEPPPPPLDLNGVEVTVELHFRLRRAARGNTLRTGAGTLRYAKNRPLPRAAGEWQAAFLLGYLRALDKAPGEEPDGKLCLVLDAQSGALHPAPGDAVRRFGQIAAACASIAERWPNIAPPAGAVL